MVCLPTLIGSGEKQSLPINKAADELSIKITDTEEKGFTNV